ncbi:MAG: 5-methyltetrahydropteroyltriglutamate--homocysteine S-methyltransferase [Candidatus Cryptobacteroides sp.]
MSKNILNAPFRADIVGSFLRPEEIKVARVRFAKGEITAEELKQVEDKCIAELVAKQKEAGLQVITDGEFRRSYWHLDFMWGFNGAEHIELDHGYFFHHEETTHGSVALTGKIDGRNHPFVEHFKFLKQFETDGVVARQTIPAPAQFYAELFRGDNGRTTNAVYPDNEELISDIAKAYRTVIRDLYDAGCRNIQLDDCTWGMVCDKNFWASMAGSGYDAEHLQQTYLRLNNLVLEERPEGLVINTHVCRGNYHSSWASEGAYDAVEKTLFARENVDAFYLEYDDERSGGFEPLASVPQDKKVVLGLITTKSPVLEDKQKIIARIQEASRYIPLDRLCLSPQCGFASCEIGNKLTEAEQWAKIRLVREIAAEVWGL